MSECVKCGHELRLSDNESGDCEKILADSERCGCNCSFWQSVSFSAASEGVPERIWVHQGNVYCINPDHADMDVAPVEYVRVSPSVDEAADASKEYVRGLEELARDVATMPMGALMDDTAPRSALMNVVSLLRHLQERSRALISQHQETK